MPAKSERPLTRICARIFTDDYNTLNEIADLKGVPFNTILREMVSSFTTQVKAKDRAKIDALEKTPSEKTHA